MNNVMSPSEAKVKSLTPEVNQDRNKVENLIPVVKQPSGAPNSTQNNGDRMGDPESIASFDNNNPTSEARNKSLNTSGKLLPFTEDPTMKKQFEK